MSKEIPGVNVFRVKLTFTERVLGSLPANPSVYRSYIATQMDDAKAAGASGEPMAGAEKLTRAEEEAAAIERAGEREEQGWSVIPVDKDGVSLIRWDYQIKGFFKGGWEAMSSAGAGKIPAGRSKIDKWLHVFSDPSGKPKGRAIAYMIGDGATARRMTKEDITLCERPLRAQTAQGPRISLKRSDSLPPGTWIEFYVHILPLGIQALAVKAEEAEAEATGRKPKLTVEDTIRLWLDYGVYSGMGEWRNAGNGRFEYEIQRLGK
jgi:hypothetical protein